MQLCHDDILNDERFVALFIIKRVKFIENPEDYLGFAYHPKLCIEKERLTESGKKPMRSVFRALAVATTCKRSIEPIGLSTP